MNEYKCWCYNCLKDDKTESGWPITLTQMILCPDCGNKRCPKATDHNNACTNSNESNQPGSRYSDEFKPVFHYRPAAYQIHKDFISPTGSGASINNERLAQVNPLVVRNTDGVEIFKITCTGDIYSKGRLVKGDDELVKATTEFMQLMVANTRRNSGSE